MRKVKIRNVAVTVLLTALLLTTVIGTATAQESGSSSAAFAQPVGKTAPNPPYFALERDGTVIIDGDEVTDCRSFGIGLSQWEFKDQQRGQARKVLERCKQLGLSSGGDFNMANSKVILEIPGKSSPTPDNGSDAKRTLPDTGGTSLFTFLISGLLLVGAGLIATRRMIR